MLISSCSLCKLTSLISFSDDKGADSCADFLADPVRVSCKFWLFNFLFVFNDDEDLEAVIIYVDGNNIVDALVFFFLLFSSCRLHQLLCTLRPVRLRGSYNLTTCYSSSCFLFSVFFLSFHFCFTFSRHLNCDTLCCVFTLVLDHVFLLLSLLLIVCLHLLIFS